MTNNHSAAKILVIDDDAHVRESLCLALRTREYDVITADNASSACELARRDLPDLILSDIRLPEKDGYWILSHLRGDQDTADIPFVFMTGFEGDETMRRGMELGADDYLVKPISIETLLATVEAQIEKRRIREQRVLEMMHIQETILHSVANAIVITNREGNIIWTNPAFTAATGYTNDEVWGKNPRVLQDQTVTHAPEFYRDMWQAISNGQVWRGVFHNRRKDGTPLIEEATITPVRNAKGELSNFVAIKQDITRRTQMEQELRREQTMFRSLVSTVTDNIYFKDRESRFVRITNCMARQFGVQSTADVVGKTDFDFFAEEHARQAFNEEQEMMRTGQPLVNIEEKETWPDGRVTWASTTKIPLRDDQGQITGLVGISRDITERKQMDEQLRQAERERTMMELQLSQAQKLESIGRLAAGIAHEINTPTQYIGDNTRFIKDAFHDLEPVRQLFHQLLEAVRTGGDPAPFVPQIDAAIQQADEEYLVTEIPAAVEHAIEGVDRVAKIVRAMKEFSHPGSSEKSRVNLNRAIDSTLTVCRNEWKYHADMVTQFAPDLPEVPCLPGEFNQVILNLVINAAHAIADTPVVKNGGKGTITVSTRLDGEWVEIRIQDTGTGIPESARQHIFEPFFTTKPVGKGTGQGLPIARSVIVDKHGGDLRFETETGKGTTFIIRLPLNPPAKAK